MNDIEKLLAIEEIKNCRRRSLAGRIVHTSP